MRCFAGRKLGMASLVLIGILLSPGWARAQNDEAALKSLNSANGLLQRGLFDLAEEEYRAFLSANPRHEKAPLAQYGLGVALFRRSQYKEAVEALTPLRVLGDFEFGAETRLILGHAHKAMGDAAAAGRDFKELVERYPQSPLAEQALVGWQESLYAIADYAAVRTVAEKFRAAYPQSAQRERVDLIDAMAAFASAQWPEAKAALERFLKSHKESSSAAQATLLLAQTLDQLGEQKEAVRRYRDGVKGGDATQVADAMLGLGSLLQRTSAAEEAADVLRRFVETYKDHPERARAEFYLGLAFLDLKRWDDAKAAFNAVAAVGGDLADDAAYWSAKSDFKADRFAQAAEGMVAALGAFPQSPLKPEMAYDAAVALARADRPAEAVEAIKRFMAIAPDHSLAPEALRLAASLAHQQGRYEASAGFCRQFLERFADKALACDVVFLDAENAFLTGDYEGAAGRYRGFLDRFAKDDRAEDARYRLGMALYRSGKEEEARPYLETVGAKKGNAGQGQSVLVLAEMAFRRGEWKPARKQYQQFLENGLDQAGADHALLKSGLCSYRLGDFADAAAAYDRLIDRFAEGPLAEQALFEKGQALVAMDRAADAEGAFKKLLADHPDSKFKGYAHRHLAALALAANRPAEAAEHFAAARPGLVDEGEKVDMLAGEGRALMAAGAFDKAEAIWRELLKSAFDSTAAPEAGLQRAICLARGDRFKEALEQSREAEGRFGERMTPQIKARLYYERAWALKALKDPDAAAAAYGAVIAAGGEPELTAHARLELGELESQRERWAEASQALEGLFVGASAKALEPKREILEPAAYQLGIAYYRQEAYEPASKALDTLIQLYPDTSYLFSALYFEGESLLKTGHAPKAAKCFERVAAECEDAALKGPALLRSGECLTAMQNYARAEEVYRQYLKDFSESELWFQARFGLGWACEQQSRLDEAIAAYREVTAKHQGETAARAQFQIGECLFAKKKFEDAVRELLKVDILYAYPEWSAAALYEAGRCFEQLSKTVEARAQFQAVVDKYQKTRWAELSAQRLTQMSRVTLGEN